MATEYETIEKTVKSQKLIRRTCDWCQGDMSEDDMGAFDVREFSLEFSSGYAYPEGGFSEGWQVEDLCDDCVAKLRAMLEGAGVSVTKLEVDW